MSAMSAAFLNPNDVLPGNCLHLPTTEFMPQRWTAKASGERPGSSGSRERPAEGLHNERNQQQY